MLGRYGRSSLGQRPPGGGLALLAAFCSWRTAAGLGTTRVRSGACTTIDLSAPVPRVDIIQGLAQRAADPGKSDDARW